MGRRPGGAPGLRPGPGPDDGAQLRLPARAVDLGPGRAVVRGRRPRPRRPRDVLRRPAAVPGRPAGHRPGRRAPGAGHAGPVGPDPGRGPRAGHRPTVRSNIRRAAGPGSRGATRPTCSDPTTNSSTCCAGTSARRAADAGRSAAPATPVPVSRTFRVGSDAVAGGRDARPRCCRPPRRRSPRSAPAGRRTRSAAPGTSPRVAGRAW